MRKHYLLNGTKPSGFIVSRSAQKKWQEESRALSLERPILTNHSKVSTDSAKLVGTIRHGNYQSDKID